MSGCCPSSSTRSRSPLRTEGVGAQRRTGGRVGRAPALRGRLEPEAQILLQSTALILYGLAARDGVEPADVSPIAVHNWAAERMLPLAPFADGPMRDAGHDVPDADVRSLDRYSDDPVILTWIDLADTDPPGSPARYSVLEQFPLPRLAIGVTALHDLNEEEDQDDEGRGLLIGSVRATPAGSGDYGACASTAVQLIPVLA